MGSGSRSNGRTELVKEGRREVGGLTGWLLARFARGRRSRPRLALLERITLAPRQSLALVEAEGRRILVATSADGASAFYPLDEAVRPASFGAAGNGAKSRGPKSAAVGTARVSR